MPQPPQVLSSLHSPFSPILRLPRSSCPIRVFSKSFKHQLLSYPEPLAFSWERQRGQTSSFSILEKTCISQFTPFPVYLPHLFAPPSCAKLPSWEPFIYFSEGGSPRWPWQQFLFTLHHILCLVTAIHHHLI